jgi:hypothetical protein
MTSLPARTGWEWIKQGFDLFRQQPGRLAFLFLGYMLFLVFVELIPVVGKPLTLVLLPVFGAAFMQAGATIDRNQLVQPGLLATGFRKPVFSPLFRLGLLYFAVFALVLGLIMLMDDGTLEKMAAGKIDPRSAEAQSAQLWKPFLAGMLIYVPAAMAFAFAVPLILWRQMGVAKAIFYSFFAVWRNLRAFLVFALGWFVLFTLATQVLALVAGPKYLAFVLQPVLVLFGILMQCSFYASYRELFGVPGAEPEPPAPASDSADAV